MNDKLLRKSALFFLLIGIFLGVLFAFLTNTPETSAAAWYNTSWLYRKKITIDHTKVSSNLTDFPVLINLSLDADLAAKALDSGNDILFTSSDGTTKLSHEIEDFSGPTGDLAAWVKIPTLSSTADTEIYIYYGNAAAANQENVENVWDSNYKMVQHLEELPVGGAPQFKDSTSYANHATSRGLMTGADQISAKIDGGLDLDGSNDYLEVCVDDCDDSLRITGNKFTLEAWARAPVGGVDDDKGLIDKRLDGDDERYMLGIADSAGATDLIDCRVTIGSVQTGISTAGVPVNAWTYLVCRYDGDLGSNNLQAWINGSNVGNSDVTGNLDDTANDDVILGKRYDARFYEGDFDELRISDNARSDAYITTSYNNQNDPSAFHGTPGAEETVDVTAPDAVADLTLSNPSTFSFDLDWTAPGDDADVGTAAEYDVRYSTADINDGNWDSATQVVGEPTPLAAGSAQSMTVTGLTTNTLYYFALKTTDDFGNVSDLSNVPSLTTLISNDTSSPAAIADLAASSPTDNTLELSWTATGDDADVGTATLYDVRYLKSAINDANWDSAVQVVGEPTPSISGSSESMTITGLLENTTYFFAIKAMDDGSNWSDLSNVPQGTTTGPPTGITIPRPTAGAVQPTTVIFSGKAFPGADIELLRRDTINPNWRNARPEEYTISDDGSFYIKYIGLITGQYFFALRAEDKDNRKTGIVSFGVNFVSEDELIAENLFIPPTISFEAAATKGSDLEISGYAGANNRVVAEIDGAVKGEGQADENGFYTLAVNTSELNLGGYYARVKQIDAEGKESISSSPRAFKITSLAYPRADFNNDNKVSVTDWSIFLFRWGSEDEELKDKIDLDNNGVIDVFDFSIFLMAMAS